MKRLIIAGIVITALSLAGILFAQSGAHHFNELVNQLVKSESEVLFEQTSEAEPQISATASEAGASEAASVQDLVSRAEALLAQTEEVAEIPPAVTEADVPEAASEQAVVSEAEPQISATASEAGASEAASVQDLVSRAEALLAQTEEVAEMPPAASEADVPEAASEAVVAHAAGDSSRSAYMHTVITGDTLWGLAGSYYEDPFQWGILYGANPETISNPDRIYPGEEIFIPEMIARAAPEPADTPEEVSAPEPVDTPEYAYAPEEVSAPEPETAANISHLNPVNSLAETSVSEIFPLSEDIPEDQQEWTEELVKVAPRNWRGAGVIASKICDDSCMPEGLTQIGDRVLIKTGDPSAFNPGDTLTSYSVGAPAYERLTGRELGLKLQKTGILEVESIDGIRVTALVVDAVTSVDKGQVVTQ